MEVPHTRKVEVWNRGSEPIHEVINDDVYDIAVNEHIVLPRGDAIRLKGYFPGLYPQGHPKAGWKKDWRLEFAAIPESGSSLVTQRDEITCNACGATFKGKGAREQYAEHAKLHEAQRVKEDDESEENVKTEKVYACPYCDFETSLKMAFLSHAKTHQKEAVAA